MSIKDKHPCFNAEAKKIYGRVHLPVVPECNIKCKYCDRKFDCVNESRPGVSSTVLSPNQALNYIRKVSKINKNISVAGIAGPGDPFANADKTLKTLKLIKTEFPNIIFCLSTNGLNISNYVEDLTELGVTHVTITVNSINPELSDKIYSWIRYDKRVYRGIDAGKILLEKQFESIDKLKKQGIIVKINSIILPGINDRHIVEIAKKMSGMNVDIMNCIPVYPNKETISSNIRVSLTEEVFEIQTRAGKFIPQMLHCSRCRADAAGLIDKDDARCFKILKEVSEETTSNVTRPYVAVASREGMLINMHLGEADMLYIFEEFKNEYRVVDKRNTPVVGTGNDRWNNLNNLVKDCRGIIVSGIGKNPKIILENSGIKIVEMSGLVREGLDFIYKSLPLRSIRTRDMFKCGKECSGTGMGCG